MFLSRLLEPVKDAARAAGDTLWSIYQSGDYEAKHKADESPVTSADLAANALILHALTELAPEIPIVSEEMHLLPLRKRQD